MWYADEVGVPTVYATVERFREEFGPQWTPAPLLAKIAATGGTFGAQVAAPKEYANA